MNGGIPFVKESELCPCRGAHSCSHKICCGKPIRREMADEHADRHERREALRRQPVAVAGGDGTVSMPISQVCETCFDVYGFSDSHTCEQLS